MNIPPGPKMRIPSASGDAFFRRMSSMFSRRPAYAIPLAVGVLLAVIGAFLADDYGVSPDDKWRRLMAVRAVDYVLGKNEDMLHHWDRLMGVAFEAPLYFAELALGLEDSRSIQFSRYLLSHWFFILGGFFCALLTHRLTGSRAVSVLAMLLFLLHPRLYAHSFFNSKDVPFASMFMISLHASWRAFDRDDWRSFALAGAAAGALTSMRIMGLLLAVGVMALQLWDVFAAGSAPKRRKRLVAACAFAGACAIMTYATWPYLWADPVARFAESMASSSAHPSVATELFDGRGVFAYDLPAGYFPKWFSMTTPPIVLVLGLGGAVAVLGRGARRFAEASRSGTLRFQLFVLGCLVAPLIAVLVLRPTLFDGWRHLYFMYAPFSLLAGLGLHYGASWMRSRMGKAAVYGVAAVSLAATTLAMVRLHPYQHVYFNSFVDKEAPERLAETFEMDYWQTSYREGLEFLLSRYPDRHIYVQGMFGETMLASRDLLKPAQRARLTINEGRSDFAIVSYEDRGRSDWRPVFGPALHSRKLYNSTMMEIAQVALPASDSATAPYREAYETIAAGNPVARSSYDIYLEDGGLAYLKEPCEASDTQAFVAIHVVPVSAADLQPHRLLPGYDDRTQPFGQVGVRFGDKCLMRAALPDYDIARVRTGFRVGGTWLWEANIELETQLDRREPNS